MKHVHKHSHTNTNTHTSLSLNHSFTLSPTCYTHIHCSHTQSLYLSHTLNHSLTPTHIHSLSPSQTHRHYLSHKYTRTHTRTHARCTHACTPFHYCAAATTVHETGYMCNTLTIHKPDRRGLHEHKHNHLGGGLTQAPATPTLSRGCSC